ncbi:MAG: hypothetical protein ICV79_04220 [Flavisolibacter sp.]|nr:hypothetical protein [Flavisolibacter sp.]
MKRHSPKVSLKPGSSFNIYKKNGGNSYNQWHFHPEIEVALIISPTSTDTFKKVMNKTPTVTNGSL